MRLDVDAIIADAHERYSKEAGRPGWVVGPMLRTYVQSMIQATVAAINRELSTTGPLVVHVDASCDEVD